MKKVNFITTLSPQKQYEIRRWFLVTLFVCISAIAVGAYFIVPQICLYWSLKKEIILLREKTKLYADVTKNRDTLKLEYDTFRVRENKINAHTNKAKNPHQYITIIMQACSEHVQLEALRCNKKECEITILCPTPEHATLFIKHLTGSNVFSHVKMVSLQHDGQNKLLRCIVKGIIITA